MACVERSIRFNGSLQTPSVARTTFIKLRNLMVRIINNIVLQAYKPVTTLNSACRHCPDEQATPAESFRAGSLRVSLPTWQGVLSTWLLEDPVRKTCNFTTIRLHSDTVRSTARCSLTFETKTFPFKCWAVCPSP